MKTTDSVCCAASHICSSFQGGGGGGGQHWTITASSSVYLWFSNKSLPVPVCLAPQIHNLHSQSALLCSFPLLLLYCQDMNPPLPPPNPPPLLVYGVMRKINFSWDTESCVSWQMHVNQQELENDHSCRSLFSLCPLGLNTCWLGKAFCCWLTSNKSIWLTNYFLFCSTA